MSVDLPNLAILPIESLVLHENHDERRAYPLVKDITQNGQLINPPIVAALTDGSRRYAVLDGANRTVAFRMLETPHILAQIVQPGLDNVALKTWNHAIWEHSPKEFLTGLRDIPGLVLNPSTAEEAYQDMLENRTLVVIQISGFGVLAAEIQPNDLDSRIKMLNRIVDSYKKKAKMDRSHSIELESIRDLYPGLCGLVIFPHFEIPDILAVASKGFLLPSGVTRFTVSPRALRVNYPIEALTAEGSLEAKNRDLQRWIQQRIATRAVRYYAEETVLYDE